MYSFKKIATFILLCSSFFTANTYAAYNIPSQKVTSMVAHVIQPLMEKYQIPGMAVAVTLDGKNYFYNVGVASKDTGQPVTKKTLFELGSVTKTFTATLAAYAEESHRVSLSNNTSQYLPMLRGSIFDKISLLNLGTHTSGLPLFVPNNIKTTPQLMDYLKQWKPPYPIGTYRVYSNIGIGLLGMSAAESLQSSFNDSMNTLILNPLGLHHTYIEIPENQLKNYAQGYTTQNLPTRMHAGVLAAQAYGLKSCTTDLIKYVEENMQEIKMSEKLQRAILNTHMAYFNAGPLTQDLVWEQYPYPVTLKQLLIGNREIFVTTRVTRITPPLSPQAKVLINKTGSTNGFSTYIAFIPEKKIGVVILANKDYPLDQRVVAGYKILLGIENADNTL